MEKQLRQYLERLFGDDVALSLATATRLPFYLVDNYQFWEVTLFGQRFLAMIANSRGGQTPETGPAALAKWIAVVAETSRLPVVYVAEAIPSYRRDRMIEQRIQFIAPGRQMFIPSLGIDLREYLRMRPKHKTADTKGLNPAAQAALLYMVAKLRDRKSHITELARELHYTKMTVSRSIAQLEDAGLVETETVGRSKLVFLKGSAHEVWERAAPMLQSPVRSTHRIRPPADVERYTLAGETALAQQTALNEPRRLTIAVASEDLNRLGFEFSPDGDVDVEAWRYDPALFSEQGLAHPLTLVLRFRGDHDERIQMALDTLLAEQPW